MPNVLKLTLALLAVGSLPASSQGLYPGSGKIRCAAVDEQMSELVDYLRMLVSTSRPEGVSARDSFRVPHLEPALVQRVSMDSLCRRAGVLLNRAFHLPDFTSRDVYLVRMGSRYWAEEKQNPKFHYIVGIVLDSTLTRILSQNGR